MSTSLLGMVPRTRLRAETHHDLVSQLLVTAGIEAVRPRESARGESTGSEVRNPVRYPFLPSERLHRGMFLAHVANVPAKRRSNRDLVVTLGTRTRCRLSARKADSSTPRGTTGIRAFEQSRWEGLGGVCSVERRRSTDPRTGNGEEPESSPPFSCFGPITCQCCRTGSRCLGQSLERLRRCVHLVVHHDVRLFLLEVRRVGLELPVLR